VPAALVPLDALPIGATGKVDRRALPTPADVDADVDVPYAAPSNEIEHRLAVIWGEVLGIERVGVDRNLFELGGHSLTAMRIVSRVQESFGARLLVTAVFDHPTIAQLAELLSRDAAERAAPSGEPGIIRVARTAQRRPTRVPNAGQQ
jgi:acyl carrier protein